MKGSSLQENCQEFAFEPRTAPREFQAMETQGLQCIRQKRSVRVVVGARCPVALKIGGCPKRAYQPCHLHRINFLTYESSRRRFLNVWHSTLLNSTGLHILDTDTPQWLGHKKRTFQDSAQHLDPHADHQTLFCSINSKLRQRSCHDTTMIDSTAMLSHLVEAGN